MAVVPLRQTATLVEPNAPSQGVSLVEPEHDPTTLTSQETDPDGNLLLTFGEAKPQRNKDAAFDANLADEFDDHSLSAIASYLLDGIDADIDSRKDWEDTANKAAGYLGIRLEDPTENATADGTICKTVSSGMLEAAARLWGVSRAELLPVSGPVKVRRDTVPSPDPSAATPPAPDAPGPTPQAGIAAPAQQPQLDGDDLGRALEADMNHYLTVRDRGYYPDFSKMLMSRNIIGLAFRKVYRDPLLRRPVSRWVKAQDLIVSNDAAHLDDAGRVTERIKLRQAVMRRLQAGGHYRDITLVHPTNQTSATELAVADAEGVAAATVLPGDFEHTVYECYCELGSGTNFNLAGNIAVLDEDEDGKKPGYPLPYRVSIDLDSREVLEIRRNWKKGDADHRARRRYVKYGFLPGFGFYDWGLIHVVGNLTQAATMVQRASVDSSLFANFPGGVFLKGPASRQQNTVIRPNPGEFVAMETAGQGKIQDVMMPMPYKPPSPEVLALAQKLEGDVRRLAGVIELPVAEGRLNNTPVGTIMSYIESISQVPGAVHKDDHIAQQDEFEMLRELFADEPEALVAGVRRPARRWQAAEEIMNPELVPAADPNTPSEVHRLLKVQGMVTLGGMPQFQGIANNRTIYGWAAETLTGDKAAEFTMPPQAAPPPQPDPRIVAAQIKAQADTNKVQAGIAKDQQQHQERMAELANEDQQRDADRQSAETRAAMSLEGTRLKTQADATSNAMDRAHDTTNAMLDRAQADRHQQQQQQQQQLTAGLTAQPEGNA